MEKRIIQLCLLLAITSCYGQQIAFQVFSAGGQGHNSVNNTLSGTFGQPIIASGAVAGFKLESGFKPALIALNSNFPPAIVFSPPLNIKSGDKLMAQVTDIDGIAKAMLYYRPIAAVEFDSVQLDPVTVNYEKTIQASWIDAMGMEYFLTATDVTGQKSLSPSSTGTYFHSYALANDAFVPASAYNIGRKTNEYKVIAVPFNFGNASIGLQFDELANEEGQHSISNYRVATYAGNNNWNEFPSQELNEFKRGKGYWFLTTIQNQISFTNPTTPAEHQQNLFQMTLSPGWNQVGNPYTVPISWENVRNHNSGLDIKALKIYQGGYADGDLLQPFTGGFVNYGGNSAVTISIPFKDQLVPGGRKRDSNFSSELTSEAWILNLNLQVNDQVNKVAAIGMHPNASNDGDVFDDFYPPRFSDYAEIAFPHPTHKEKVFAKDIVSSQPQYQWTFEVNASGNEEPVLQWDNESIISNGLGLFLFDQDRSQLVDMTLVGNHQLRRGNTYKIYYGDNVLGEIQSEISQVGDPYPNPIGQLQTLTIPFMLERSSKSFDVTINLIDMQGRTVRQLIHKPLPPGYHKLLWDGKDESGTACAEGMYIVRVIIENNAKQISFHKRIIVNQRP